VTLMVSMAKLAVNRTLGVFGVQLANRNRIPSWEQFFALLKRAGFRPKTVFDIGVANGTPQLYAAFPGASFVLIDPTRESLRHMEQIAGKIGAKIYNCAVGDKEARMQIITRSDIGASSFFDDCRATSDVIQRYEVDVRRFDALFADFSTPALCKIDVQGAELMVIRGMSGVIHKIDVLIVEVSTIATLIEGPEAAEVIATLSSMGLKLYDVISINRRPLDGAVAQIDFAFVQDQSQFRSDRRWQF
jgi:FkbM family methyltransferase